MFSVSYSSSLRLDLPGACGWWTLTAYWLIGVFVNRSIICFFFIDQKRYLSTSSSWLNNIDRVFNHIQCEPIKIIWVPIKTFVEYSYVYYMCNLYRRSLPNNFIAFLILSDMFFAGLSRKSITFIVEFFSHSTGLNCRSFLFICKSFGMISSRACICKFLFEKSVPVSDRVSIQLYVHTCLFIRKSSRADIRSWADDGRWEERLKEMIVKKLNELHEVRIRERRELLQRFWERLDQILERDDVCNDSGRTDAIAGTEDVQWCLVRIVRWFDITARLRIKRCP